MTDLLRLHYAPDNASLIIRLALEELHLPYETILVDRKQNAHNSAAFRAINPAGKIPALETPFGVMFETAAILLWLADSHKALAPPPDSPDRPHFLKWLFYVSNTLHANLRMTFYPSQYIPDAPEAAPALTAGARANVLQGLTLMEAVAGAGHDWCNGKTPSALDLYMAALMRWMALYPNDSTDWFVISEWPNLLHMAARLQARASVTALCAAEGMSAHPFTQPKPPHPPEGSAI
ncbi:glutathione S-transferase family protein [Shimia sp. NS0008-38b]|uniref:glutathione S-transferase family protein n=1 Tax=Shimia sp. NS0008-38b TaxID=3127653 RepID=UPI003109660E